MNENQNSKLISDSEIITKIYFIRNQKVMLDRDLAILYRVETRILNQAVKRNIKRFPIDFMFQLTEKELKDWKSQIVISNSEIMGLRKLPFAFTEQGVAMLSSVLNSDTAIDVNIQIIRIFTKIREMIINHKDTLLKLEKLENQTSKNNSDIQTIFQVLKKLIIQPIKERKPIGYRGSDKPKKN